MRKNNKIIKNINKQIKIRKILILSLIILISLLCFVNITKQNVKQQQIKKLGEKNILEYEITEKVGEDVYDILIKITEEDGIEYIKYPEGDILYTKGKKTVGIDYQIEDEEQYDFIIKPDGKEEITETIHKQVPKIEGNYQLVKGVYLNIPDISGYKAEYTRYLDINKETEEITMTPGKWITESASEEWFDYKNSKWANIYFEKDGVDIYYVWIPRYCFKLDQKNQRSEVKFIDTNNNFIDENGNKTTWKVLKEQGYQVPEAFQFNGTRIPGYWQMKYTAGESTKPSIVSYDLGAIKDEIIIRNITLNTSITNTNPITKYTIALNGQIIETITDETRLENITSETININNINDGGNIINVTGLNTKGEIVGSMTRYYNATKANKPDLSKFDKDTTYYVKEYNTEREYSFIPICKEEPNDWYEYAESRGAHIVTRIAGVERYYTWIPRYETKTDINGNQIGNFIAGTSTQITQGYTMPSEFTIDGQEVTGYWREDKVIGYNEVPQFNTEVVSTNTNIITKGIIGKRVEEGQIYKYYLDGEYKGQKENATEQFEYKELEANRKYTMLIEIRNKETDAYIGTVVKQLTTIEPNKPELTGFNTKYTRYLIENENGKLTPGEWVNKEAERNWYDYSTSKWANIYFEKDGVDVYYVWIPRYEFMITSSQQAQPQEGRTEVRFVQGIMGASDGYQIPEAFTVDKNGNGEIEEDEQLSGYWIMKYTAGDKIPQSIVEYDYGIADDAIKIRNIRTNESITNTNPITKYTIAINGKIIETIEGVENLEDINSKIIEIREIQENENIINVTGLNANGEIVGSMTRSCRNSKPNKPDLSKFDKNTTFYVTDYNKENEYSHNPIIKQEPPNWYEYGQGKGAHIVTRIAGVERYYTWIPRYETKKDINGKEVGNYISGTSTETLKGYKIPEQFTVDGVEVEGYWREDKVIGYNEKPLFNTEIVATSTSIKTKGISGTKVEEGQKYKYFLDGEYAGEKEEPEIEFEYNSLETNKKYTVIVEIRNKETDEYIGTIAKTIKTIEANKPDLTGFNINEGNDTKGNKLPVTYYVEYNENGQNERIGNKVEKDTDGNATNMPNNWYDYSKSKWANIVVTDGEIVDGRIENATKTTYYVWIPRYEFIITSSQQAQPQEGRTEVRFIEGTSTETDEGYQIPEAFTFNGVEIKGYWQMKYTSG